MTAAMLWYIALSPRLALGIGLFLAACFALTMAVERYVPLPLWQVALAVFVLAWIGQFVGHVAEGKRPSFFKDVQFLMIGPLWLMSFVYRRLGIRF